MPGKTPTYIGGYQIQKKLGEGAFGRVYQAYDARVNRLVAIKVLLLTDKEVVTRFKNEAIVAGNLRHNNIVTIYEFGEHEGLPFLAMEFLDGENLQEVIRSKKELTMLQKISIMTQIAEGLDCAHRHGVVHRDVKPANMMLLPDGTVKIMDFGIARLTGGQEASRLTQQGNVLGTLLYMAPEQFQANSEVDALCDIFACGEVFYELLAYRHPFEANEPRVLLYKVNCEDPPPLRSLVPDCPPALEQVLTRMLSKPRDLRYHSLREVLFDTQPVLIDLQQERASTLMVEAQELFSRQDAEAANALMPEILDLDPGNRTAYRLREQIQRALLKPRIEAFIKTGRDELAKRKFQEAIQALDAAARLDTANTEIHDLLAQARSALEQSQRASQLVSEARQAFDQQNLTAAYKCASEALLYDPDNPHASRLLLVIQSAIDRKRQQQQLEEALLKAEHLLMIQAYDQALEALAGLDAADERVAQLAARIQAQKLEHERGIRLQTGMAVATELLREQKLEEAVIHLRALFAEFMDKPEVRQLFDYARKELAAQQRAQAIEQIRVEAEAKAEARDFKGALEVLDQALQKYDDGSLVRLLGAVMSRKAAWEREEALRAARAKAERLRADGKLPDAIQVAESAVRNFSNDPAMLELLRALERDWEQQKRAEDIRAAVAQSQRLLELGQVEKVLRTLPDIARRYPDSTELQEVMAAAQQLYQVQERQRDVETMSRDARLHADRANFDSALQLLDRGLQKYSGDAALLAVREEIVQKQAALVRRQDVQRILQEANRLASEGKFQEALELVGEGLKRYQGEASLLQTQSRLEADWERRRREQAIVDAGNQGRALLEQGKSAEAVELLSGALERYPGARELESMLARAQRSAAVDQFTLEVRALMDQRSFDAALKRIDQGLRSWPGERGLVLLRGEAAAGMAALLREQAIHEAVEHCRALISEGRPADALRLADAGLREYPAEAGLLAARQEAQVKVEEAERARRRTADLNALTRLEADTRSISDAAQINDQAERVKAFAKAYPGDAEFEAVAARTLGLFAQMQDAVALLAKRDFPALQEACKHLREQYPNHVLFQRLEAEAARGARQAALQEVRRKVQTEQDLHGKAQLLEEALRLYPDEAWLQQEVRVVRGKLALVSSIVEKARAAEQAGHWDEAIEQWTSMRQLFAGYPGLEDRLQSLAKRKEQARAQARVRYLEQIRRQMASADHEQASEVVQTAAREFPGDSELLSLRDQIEFALRSVQEARTAASRQQFQQASRILENALTRYSSDPYLKRELQAVTGQAAARENAIVEAVRHAEELTEHQQLDEAWNAVEAAIAQYGEEPRLIETRRRLQALRKQVEQIQQAVRQARALALEQKFPQAAKVIETELGRYPGDPVLERELATIREGVERLEALRAQTIREAVEQIHGLAGNSRLEDARKLAESSLQRFPGDPDLTAAAEQVYAAIEEAERLRKRGADLDVLHRLESDARSLTASSQIPGMTQRLKAIAASYPDDAEIAQLSAAIQQRLEALQQAGVLLARREYAGVLEICARYPDHRLLQGLKTEAERGQRVSRVADVQRQLDAEPDLRRQAELLDATIRFFPDEASLLERSRLVQGKLGEVETVAQNARQAEKADRLDEALGLWNRVRGLYKDYPGLDEAIARLEQRKQQARAAERERLGEQIWQLLNAADYDKATSLLQQAQQQFPGDAELQYLNDQVQAVRLVVRQVRALVADSKLSQAVEAIETALREYPGDKLLEHELEAVHEQEARQAGQRAEAIRQAAAKIEALTRDRRLPDAARLVESSLRQYPGEASLLAAQQQVQAAQAEEKRRQQRNNDLTALRRLDSDAKAVTDAARITALDEKVRKLAGAYPDDEEIAQAAAGIQQQLSDMTRAKALFDRKDFAGALGLCAQYPGHQFFARLKTDAERGDRSARVAEVTKKLDAESDLMRQIELLDATIRFFPDEGSLLQRSRVIRTKLDQVDSVAAKARQAEKEERWDDALAQWAAVAQLYKDYPGLDKEIERVTTLQERARAARREKLGDQIWQLVNSGDYEAAAELLQKGQQEFPGDAEMQFLREQVDSVLDSLREARSLTGDGKYTEAVRVLEEALERNAGDIVLQRELQEIRRHAERQEAVEETLAAAGELRKQQKFDDALLALEKLTAAHGAEPAVDKLAGAIRQDREAAQRKAEVRDAVSRVRKLAREGNHEAIIQFVRESPPHVQQDAEIREVLAAAGQIIEEQRQRQAGEELIAQARTLAQQYRFPDALEMLDRGARQYPALASQIAAVRAEFAGEHAAWQQVRDAEQSERDLQAAIRRAADMLAQNPAGAVAILTDLRARYPQRADVAQQFAAAHTAQARFEAARLAGEVDQLCAKKKYAAALQMIDHSGLSGPDVSALRQRVQALVSVHDDAVEPRPRGKIAWIAGGVAALALGGWGISTLMRSDSTLVVETLPEALVSVDRAEAKPADGKGIFSLKVKPGSHTLSITKPGFENAEQTVEVKSGASDRVTISLKPSGREQLKTTPVIASLDPGSVVNLGAAFNLTVTGSGFQSGSTVRWNNVPLRTTYAKATQLRAAVPANLVANPGKAVITVVNPGNLNSKPITLPINPSAPAISGMEPKAVNAGDAGFVLRVSGTAFQPGATVLWNSERLSTTIESGTSLRAAVPPKLIARSGSASVVVMNPGDAVSSAVTFTINSLTPTPAISSLNPPSATAGSGAFVLTVSGSNFVPGAGLRWNGSALTATVSGPTQLRVQVPANLVANAGNARLTVVNPGNVSSPEVNLSITAPAPAPAIGSLNLNAAAVNTAVSLIVFGSNFQSGATVEFNRSAVPTTFVSATQLRAAVPANLTSSPGAATVVVMNPGGVASAPATFTINAPVVVPPPVLGSLNPSSVVAGGAPVNLVATGSGFAQGSIVHWNRAPLTTTFVSATQLRASVPANMTANAGTVSVTVVNPENVASGAVNFTITAPAVVVPPAISEIKPNSTVSGGPRFMLTVNGSGFQQGAVVEWNRVQLLTRPGAGPGQLLAAVPPNLTTAPGTASITVVNPGNVTSGAVTLTLLPRTDVPRTDPDVELVKSVLSEYAAAYSQKNIRKVTALFPTMPRQLRDNLQDAFSRSEYTVQFAIDVIAPPVIKGDDATVLVRTTIHTSFGKRVNPPVTEQRVVTLRRSGGQWTIAGIR